MAEAEEDAFDDSNPPTPSFRYNTSNDPGGEHLLPPDTPGSGPYNNKTKLSHTNSLPGSQHLSPGAEPMGVFKQHSLRIKRTNDGGGGAGGGAGGGWSFGGVAKGLTAFGSGVVQGTRAVGSGVVQGTKAVGTGVVQSTKAVGEGVVQGTKAVGEGVVQGTKAVGTGVVEGTKVVGDTVVSGSKAVGSGVVEGTKAVAKVSTDMTLAAGNQVVKAGEVAVSGVSAAGNATLSAGMASVGAMKDFVHDSLGPDDEIHTVVPGEDLSDLAKQYGVGTRDLIRANSLNRRALRPGQGLVIPRGLKGRPKEFHQSENLALKADCGDLGSDGTARFTLHKITWSLEGNERVNIDCKAVQRIFLDMEAEGEKPAGLPELLPAKEVVATSGSGSKSPAAEAEKSPRPPPPAGEAVSRIVEVNPEARTNTADSSPDESMYTGIHMELQVGSSDGENIIHINNAVT